MNAEHADVPVRLPKVTPSERARALRLLALLREHYPGARCELNYATPHELLVATILSAQTTDAGVNRATPALFARFPTPGDYARATPEQIEPYVRSLGFFCNKSKAIHLAMKDVVERFGGHVPRTMEDLLTLHGVARKTANVVLGNAYGLNFGIPVDTHVQRLSQRLGLAPQGAGGKAPSVDAIEARLMALFPREAWGEVSHLIIWHGRRACKARLPRCAEHPVCRDFGACCELRGPARAGKAPRAGTRPKKRRPGRGPKAR